MHRFATVLALASWACSGKAGLADDSAIDFAGSPADGDQATPTLPPFTVEWGPDALSIAAQDGESGAGWRLGLCAVSPDSDDSWDAESCVDSQTLDDGTVVSYCHEMGVDFTELVFGGDPYALAEGTTAAPAGWHADAQVMFFPPDWDFDVDPLDNLTPCTVYGNAFCGRSLEFVCEFQSAIW